jgi:hypothetical protein
MKKNVVFINWLIFFPTTNQGYTRTKPASSGHSRFLANFIFFRAWNTLETATVNDYIQKIEKIYFWSMFANFATFYELKITF